MPRFAEFVTLIAALMALTALSIDVMLPALPQMRAEFGVLDANRQQLVLTSYVVGFALGQLFHGPLSDWLGRKPVLLAGLAVYALASFACLIAHELRLPARGPLPAGPCQCRAAGRGGGGGARHLRRAAHGRGDVLRDDGLHRRAGGGADHRRGLSPRRQLAPDLRLPLRSSRSPSSSGRRCACPRPIRPQPASRSPSAGSPAPSDRRSRRRRPAATRWRPASSSDRSWATSTRRSRSSSRPMRPAGGSPSSSAASR